MSAKGWYTIRTDYSFLPSVAKKTGYPYIHGRIAVQFTPQTRHSFNCNHGIYPSIFHSIGLHALICSWRKLKLHYKVHGPSSKWLQETERDRSSPSNMQWWAGRVGWDGGEGLVWLLSLPVSSGSCCAQSCLFVTSWTVAHQAPLCMGYFRQENWSGLPFPIPGYLPVPGIEPASCMVLYILSNQTDYTMVFYLQSVLLFAFLASVIASSNRGGSIPHPEYPVCCNKQGNGQVSHQLGC